MYVIIIKKLLEAFSDIFGLGAVLDGLSEEVDVVGERVLVHGVDIGKVGDAEEEVGGLLGHGLILASREIDLLFGLLGDLLLLGDLVALALAGLEHLDALLVLEDVGGVGEHV